MKKMKENEKTRKKKGVINEKHEIPHRFDLDTVHKVVQIKFVRIVPWFNDFGNYVVVVHINCAYAFETFAKDSLKIRVIKFFLVSIFKIAK